MKRLLVVVVAGLLVAAALMVPTPRPPESGPLPDLAEPRFAVCLVEEGAGRSSEISIASFDAGGAQTDLYSNGRLVGSLGQTIPERGSSVIPVVDITAVGTVVGMVELPSSAGGAATLTRGTGSLAAEGCVSGAPTDSYLAGGNTVGGGDFDVYLMNPFAVDAAVRLAVSSEVGSESNSRFESITVLARSFVVIEMRQLIPGREDIRVNVETLGGRVVSFARQASDGLAAVWAGSEMATDWYLPLPGSGEQVRIGSPAGPDVEYQVDVYGESGTIAAVLTGLIPANGEFVFNPADHASEELGPVRAVRVITNSPSVTTLQLRGEGRFGVTAGATSASRRWVAPGSLEAPPPPESDGESEVPPLPAGRLVILNPGIEDAFVVVSPSGPSGAAIELTVPAEGVAQFDFGTADAHFIESDMPVVVLWVAGDGDALSLGVMVPGE